MLPTQNYVFVLGSPDPEMFAIEWGLCCIGVAPRYAQVEAGRRVTPEQAYSAVAPIVPATSVAVLVECRVPVLDESTTVIIDHHSEGDPGYGRPVEDSAMASSLGQMVEFLGKTHGEEAMRQFIVSIEEKFDVRWQVIAACDHALKEVYQGRVPGVSKDEALKYRFRVRTNFLRLRDSEYISLIEIAKDALIAAPDVIIANNILKDLRSIGTVPEITEVSAIMGIGFLSKSYLNEGTTEKMSIFNAPKESVSEWVKHAREIGLIDIYGDPIRGFAGGYRRLKEGT